MSTLHGEYRRHTRTGIKTNVSVDLSVGNLDTKTLDVSERGIAIQKPAHLSLETGQTVNIIFNRMTGKAVPARIVHVGGRHIGLQLEDIRFSEQDIEGIINSAPWWQRQIVSLRRLFWKQTRRSAVLLINSVLRQLILTLVRPTFIFAVYGNERDVSTYYTPRILKMIPPLIIGGFIRNGKRRGLMIGSKFLESELAQDSIKVRQYLTDLEAEFPDIQKIALVGRMPNFVMKAGISITAPYVDGSMGTRYMIWDVARQMRALPDYHGENGIVVLGGAGRIGNKVCEDLAREFSTVVAFDPRYDQEERINTPMGVILRTAKASRLSDFKLFIGLTHHGDVIQDLQPYLSPGSLIADDTHPSISTPVRAQLATTHIKVMKIVLSHDEFSIWPRMPAWNNRDIPGCLVEALVLQDQGDTNLDELDAFCQTALRLGFKGKLVAPLDD
ncbi:MAG TPA: PilZ domain-containing protein [Dongiaceae bacterium]|nr:PilZ domain-containing protein [Dongiaceae bacterium]